MRQVYIKTYIGKAPPFHERISRQIDESFVRLPRFLKKKSLVTQSSDFCSKMTQKGLDKDSNPRLYKRSTSTSIYIYTAKFKASPSKPLSHRRLTIHKKNYKIQINLLRRASAFCRLYEFLRCLPILLLNIWKSLKVVK